MIYENEKTLDEWEKILEDMLERARKVYKKSS